MARVKQLILLSALSLLWACGGGGASPAGPGVGAPDVAQPGADVVDRAAADAAFDMEVAGPAADAAPGAGDVAAQTDALAATDLEVDVDAAAGSVDATADATSDPMAEADADITDEVDVVVAPPDPLDLAGLVSGTEITRTIADLVALDTRLTGTPGEAAARDYLVTRLEAYGLEVELDSFMVGPTETANLIARKVGAVDADAVWIFSAHYDSTSTTPFTNAPGADDNASGVAAVLEAARLLEPLALRDSVWFVMTAAEEQGALGAKHMITWLPAAGVEVRGVMAPDMIGYWPLGDGDAFDILGDSGSEHLVSEMAGVAQVLGVAHKAWIEHDYCYGDDHTWFQEAGFPAFTPMDCVEAHNLPGSGELTPHYHQPSDTMATLHLPFTTKVVGVLVATLAMWAEPQ